MHYYRFHIKDYRAKTAHLTPLEHYVYRTLIDWYYLKEKPFESVEQIARYLLLPLTDENRTAINAVLDEFFNFHKGKYYHSRIRQEVKDYNNGEYKWDDDNETGNASDNDKVTDGNGKNNAKSNGKALSASDRQARYKQRQKMLKALSDKGITLDAKASFNDVCNAYNANFANTDNETGNASDNDKVTQNNGKNGARTINHKPLTNNQSNISPQTPQGDCVGDGASDESNKTQTTQTHTSSATHKTLNVSFETFWGTYDKKVDPKKCRPLWERLSDQDRLDIMAYIPKYKQAQPEKKYRKNPQTFLNARSWESEIITSQPAKPSDKFYGTSADPLAVNQKNFPTPPNWEENLAKLLAEQEAILASQSQPKQPKAPMGLVEI